MESFESDRSSAQDLKDPKDLEAENTALKEQIKFLEKKLGNRDERIKYLEGHAFVDSLTGASNRGAFNSELEQSLKLVRGEIGEHRKGIEPLEKISLVMLDLDHFKNINDTLGHPAGDEVLREVSKLLLGSVRETDMVARYGGEEFIILLRNVDQLFAAQKAEELRAAVEKTAFDAYPDLKVTASFGVISSKASTDAKILCKQVDKMLYKSKETGRNRVEEYTES